MMLLARFSYLVRRGEERTQSRPTTTPTVRLTRVSVLGVKQRAGELEISYVDPPSYMGLTYCSSSQIGANRLSTTRATGFWGHLH